MFMIKMLKKYILKWYSRIFFNNLKNHSKIAFRILEVNSKKLVPAQLHIRFNIYITIIIHSIRRRVDDLSFFEHLSPFCFLSMEFHCTFFHFLT